jgi:CDP-diacylglycerol--glycerol-3-phosphate 3-phosphatidyltransferase
VIDGHRKTGTKSTRASIFEKSGINPDLITLAGILLALVAAFFIILSWLWVGLFFLIVAGLADLFDGMIARATKRFSVVGSYLDSVADRVIDSVLFVSVAWYMLDKFSDKKLALLPILALALGYLISYQRAKAESLGMSAKGGIMERAERLIVLGTAISFNGFFLIPLLVILCVLSGFTAVQRFVLVYSQARAKDRGVDPAPRHKSKQKRRRSETSEIHWWQLRERFKDPNGASLESRWRQWRSNRPKAESKLFKSTRSQFKKRNLG